jgi:hypothetical protein
VNVCFPFHSIDVRSLQLVVVLNSLKMSETFVLVNFKCGTKD